METQIRKSHFLAVLIVVFGMSVLFAATIVFSHDDDEEQREAVWPADSLAVTSQPSDTVDVIINESYQSVRHIFEYSCFDCHSNLTSYPWYYKIPGIKGMIDEDIKEARGHFDLSDDFPFISEHSQLDLLNDIKEEIENNDMPLLSYRMMHWGKLIEGAQRDSVFQWIDSSIALLKQAEETDE